MRMPALFVFSVSIGLWFGGASASAQENAAKEDTTRKNDGTGASVASGANGAFDVAKIAKQARGSLVVITFEGRNGKRGGLGSGFVVSADGLIATNLHVIGEARPISVQLADGSRHGVTSVHASDRNMDLALIRIDVKQKLPALRLGDSDTLKQGQPVVALGNPQGLKYSVVSGVVSGRRKIDNKPMIQLAIPIEPGNSGGPLLDAEGRVHGLLTMKSLVTDNLGFAVEINALKPLLEKPNPIPMNRWLTIGELDSREWRPQLGGRWRQRAGHILVDGLGSGFGGRSYCVYQEPPPEEPYEVAVTVKLDNETGAAGLIFSDDGQRHYGFYPTSGKLRLTRFEGPDVRTWNIIESLASKDYRANEWNTLKVRVEAEKLLCYVNDTLVIEARDARLRGGKAGLAKFRHTAAEFKNFRLGQRLPRARASDKVTQRIVALESKLSPAGPVDHLVEGLLADAEQSVLGLEDQAWLLEQKAKQLRRLAREVHQRQVLEQLDKTIRGDDDKIDLFRAGLLIARLDNDEVEIPAYQKELERLADDVKQRFSKGASDADRLAELNKFLFAESGFHGSRTSYYNRSNSYLNEVLDDREGLPVTLSVLYIELARRCGLRVEGVGLPGHFIVRHISTQVDASQIGANATSPAGQLIDVFDGGKPLTRQQAAALTLNTAGVKLEDDHLKAVPKRAIVLRMLGNLLGLARRDQDAERMLRYLDAILVVAPDAGGERWVRAVLRYETKRLAGAKADTAWLLEHHPPGVNAEDVHNLQRLIEEQQ